MGGHPKRGTPEYEAWILTPEYEEFCDKYKGKNNPMFGKHAIPKKGTTEYEAWILTPEYIEFCRKLSYPKKGTPEYEAWILTPEYIKHCEKCREINKGKPRSEEHCKNISISRRENPCLWSEERKHKKSEESRGEKNPMFHKKRPDLSERNKYRIITGEVCGEKNPNYKGGKSFEPYCLKFNPRFKRNVRAFQHYRCALCGHIWQPGEVALTVHHIHANKDSCCDESAPRDFVCLCSRKGANGRSCHHVTIGKEELFAPRFMRYLLKNFGGKSYFTKEEMEEYNDAKDINSQPSYINGDM